jgi:hypothetical protein
MTRKTKSSSKRTVKTRQTRRSNNKKATNPRTKVSRTRATNRTRRVYDSTPREIEQGLAWYKPSKILTQQAARLDRYSPVSKSKKYDDSLAEDYTIPSDPKLRKLYDELDEIVDI